MDRVLKNISGPVRVSVYGGASLTSGNTFGHSKLLVSFSIQVSEFCPIFNFLSEIQIYDGARYLPILFWPRLIVQNIKIF